MLIETPAASTTRGQTAAAGWPRPGFSDTYVEHLVGPDSMVVGIK